jgi:hypothetical protein
MLSHDVARIVRKELEEFTYEVPPPGTTVGVPWSEEKVRSYLPKLRAALVEPYVELFQVRDTYEETQVEPPITADYWVVAEAEHYIEFFDPDRKDFGLAERVGQGGTLRTIGVRGDLVGVFCAM